MTTTIERGRRFRYHGFEIDAATNRLTCRYSLDGRTFTEVITFPAGGDWRSPAATAAARLVFLLAGVSYFKTAAPPIVDLGGEPLNERERSLLRSFYLDGLAEFAHQNAIDLRDLEFVAEATGAIAPTSVGPASPPLVPFGGGLDSIVSVEMVRAIGPASLFIVNRPNDQFPAIERAAAITRLPIVRAERAIDPQLLTSSAASEFLSGHVPITGMISAVAFLAAVLEHRSAVIMSNEWSASMGTVAVGDRWINHQYSKSYAFEEAFRAVVRDSVTPDVDYFSILRPYTELWIARRFTELDEYHSVFHSCNRAFASDPALRLDHWCGVCSKCCFIDLILAPFLEPSRLNEIFGGSEPLANPSLQTVFESLIGTTATAKPFECVGDIAESRAAISLAAARPDRVSFPMLRALADSVSAAGHPKDVEQLLTPLRPHFVPDAYAPDDLLV